MFCVLRRLDVDAERHVARAQKHVDACGHNFPGCPWVCKGAQATNKVGPAHIASLIMILLKQAGSCS